MRHPLFSIFVLMILISRQSLAATPSATEHWTAASETASAITGNVTFSPDRIIFGNGQSFSLAYEKELSGFKDDMGDKVDASLYRIITPANPVLLNKNRLCGGHKAEPVTYIVVWHPEAIGADVDPRSMEAFSGAAFPSSSNNANSCGVYGYEAGKIQ